MKKVYAMLTLFAVMSLSASAQVEQQVVDEAADAALLNERSYAPGSVIRKVEEAPKAPIGYKNPEGTYWISLSEKNYGYSGYTFLFSSPCVPLEFTAIHGDTVSREWKYVDPSEEYGMFNPKLTSTEKTINLTYTYAKPTQIEIPDMALRDLHGGVTCIEDEGDTFLRRHPNGHPRVQGLRGALHRR